jgi:membrane-associated phospholipid phosphatase
MPSLHLTWAMLVAWGVTGRRRWAFGIYAALMSLAVVAGGEHYFIDVLAAGPFFWMVTRLAPFARRKLTGEGKRGFAFPGIAVPDQKQPGR